MSRGDARTVGIAASRAGMTRGADAAGRIGAASGPGKLPADAALDIAKAIDALPKGERPIFVDLAATLRGVCASWIYIRTQPFRRRRRAHVIASIASAYTTLPHGERTAYLERAARELRVHRSTVYRWMQPFRCVPRGRIKAYMATDIAIEAREVAAAVLISP